MAALVVTLSCRVDNFNDSFISVSEANPRYLCIGSDDEPYIPIGCNIAAVGSISEMETYIRCIHENGGNFGRVWLNSSLFEIEKEYDRIDSAQIRNIDTLLMLALKYEIKVKLCIESFRHIVPGKNKWDTKASYHTSNGGPFENMTEYICTEAGKKEFLKRLKVLQKRYGDHPAVFGWELWNEMNAVNAPEKAIMEWNEEMLPVVKDMFPKNMVMQSLGSLDNTWGYQFYQHINALPHNELSQVHRYLDEGAPLQICQAPVDVFCADAIEYIRDIGEIKPLLLAESGAVKPVHTGPSLLYPKDTLGTILHDVLFTPFFCGAAGPGHLWHWDHHIIKQNTWFQMQRFANAIAGINPIKERFEPVRCDSGRLRSYALKGRNTTLVWCRDTVSSWRNELERNIPAEVVSGEKVSLKSLLPEGRKTRISIYDPWEDKWTTSDNIPEVLLPDFRRSIMIKAEY